MTHNIILHCNSESLEKPNNNKRAGIICRNLNHQINQNDSAS